MCLPSLGLTLPYFLLLSCCIIPSLSLFSLCLLLFSYLSPSLIPLTSLLISPLSLTSLPPSPVPVFSHLHVPPPFFLPSLSLSPDGCQGEARLTLSIILASVALCRKPLTSRQGWQSKWPFGSLRGCRPSATSLYPLQELATTAAGAR